jgi:hypothetical protein
MKSLKRTELQTERRQTYLWQGRKLRVDEEEEVQARYRPELFMAPSLPAVFPAFLHSREQSQFRV